MIYSHPPNAFLVVTLTHTARWVTMEVEPEVPILDQPKGWQDETQGFLWNNGATGPFGVCRVQLPNSSSDLTIVAFEVLDVHWHRLTIDFQ